MKLSLRFLSFTIFALILCGCNNKTPQHRNAATSSTRSRVVVVYCSVDEEYARPIFRALEQKTGLTIRPLFDVEAAKTAGLASRIRAEKSRPRADIFWSSATLQTLLLSREGLLQKQNEPQNASAKWRGGDWIATGTRCRVLVYNASVKEPPRVLEDLLAPRFKNQIGVSNALFGTASDWSAALSTRRGTAKTLEFFRQLKANGARVLPGNSVVAERVGRGEILAGVCDTDDFLALQKQFPDLKIALPPTQNPADGLSFVPMTAAILRNAPHLQNAQKLLNALASPEIEAKIVKSMPGVLPLRSRWSNVPASIAPLQNFIEKSPNDVAKWPVAWQKINAPLSDILLRN